MSCSSGLGVSLRLGPNPLQSLTKIDLKLVKGAIIALGSANQDVVGTVNPSLGKNDSGDFPKPPFHSVANDRVADFFRDSEPKPKCVIAIVASPDQ